MYQEITKFMVVANYKIMDILFNELLNFNVSGNLEIIPRLIVSFIFFMDLLFIFNREYFSKTHLASKNVESSKLVRPDPIVSI